MFNMTQITVRNVDSDAFREFKAEATRRGMKLGTALTLAMERFKLEKRKSKLTDWKSTNWGKGTEHLSEEVDEILYGGK